MLYFYVSLFNYFTHTTFILFINKTCEMANVRLFRFAILFFCFKSSIYIYIFKICKEYPVVTINRLACFYNSFLLYAMTYQYFYNHLVDNR